MGFTKRIVFFLLSVCVLCIAWSRAAFAGDGTALTDASQIVIDILVPSATVFVLWLVHRLIRLLEKKTGFDIPDKQEQKIDQWAEEGMHWAEERSRKKLHEKSERLSGPEKLETAADFVMEFVVSNGWTDWTRDKIRAKIESKLGIKRAGDGKPQLDKSL